VVKFAIFHIILFQKEKKRKKALLHGMWMLVGTRWNQLAMVCERKNVGRSAKLYKRAPKCQSLSQNLLFCMEDSKNPIASRWQRQPPLKTKFLSPCFTNEKLKHMFNPCFPLRRAFLLLLCWVSTFYLYAPSKRA
jgi:hypothetical protein